ncbi:MAG: hypothetical protein V4649_06075 [Bacteroidota bacterium]
MRPTLITLKGCIALVCFCMYGAVAHAQEPKKHKCRNGSFYASWGYNTEWYTRSDVYVDQPSLGNKYKLVKVDAHDKRGWDDKLLQTEITIPQYNYRLGYYFNDAQDMAIEINFDHTKYIITDGQNVRVQGMVGDAQVDELVAFTKANGFYYYLNNGANFLLFNFVKRYGLYNTHSNNLRVDLTGKAGVGPVIPHVENSFFGKANDPHFQIGGWNAGLETALRVTVMRYAFIEFAQKIDYARYSNLKIYKGTAKQSFGTYELILSAGIILPTHKHNPMFVPESSSKPD